MSKNIVIAPCGNKASVFKDFWLRDKTEKDFDICLLFYDEEIEDSSLYADIDYFYHLKGFKYRMISQLFTEIHPDWFEKYEYFYFLDDDIEIDTRQISSIFQFSKIMGSWISCASLTRDSYCSWPIFKHASGSFCRFVGQIEVMAPLFSREALKKCIPSFTASLSSWGIDSVWSKLLGYPEDKLIVFDLIQMKHVNPVGEGDLYKKIGVNPHDEWNAVIGQYGAKKHNYREYGRYMLVDSKNSPIIFAGYRFKQFVVKIKRCWMDYNLNSRIKNRVNKFFRKTIVR